MRPMRWSHREVEREHRKKESEEEEREREGVSIESRRINWRDLSTSRTDLTRVIRCGTIPASVVTRARTSPLSRVR
jgi:hypothetical protein